eukprot:TRINITY_DN25054_c0_g1_i1.p1 TRINITY_DN25054_c0_g1~~TRINITY_DN25054_c0_g1_i1.p1  ORF type:complete len:489 (+),score=112.73 TRINITY_DN25054_c0_g1_i1:192-1469(+)
MGAPREALSSSIQPPVQVPRGPLQGEALWEAVKAEVLKPWTSRQDNSCRSTYSSLVIFDWDDTLLPTASLVASGRIAPAAGSPGAARTSGAAASALLNEWEFDSFLEACAAGAIQALQEAAKLGRVVIVTNSGFGWVHETASRFMPSVLSELENVPVISARSIFEPLGVAEPYRWKVHCFQRIAECFQFDPAGITGPSSLVSIGDGWHERVAAIMTAQDLKLACHVKCMKLLEQPGVDQLAQQLDLCVQVLEGITSHPSWVEACYTWGQEGLQLEARAADTAALGGTFASKVQGTVELDHREERGTQPSEAAREAVRQGADGDESRDEVGKPHEPDGSLPIDAEVQAAQTPSTALKPNLARPKKRLRRARSGRFRVQLKALTASRAGLKGKARSWLQAKKKGSKVLKRKGLAKSKADVSQEITMS